jgi:hypothetical protein
MGHYEIRCVNDEGRSIKKDEINGRSVNIDKLAR